MSFEATLFDQVVIRDTYSTRFKELFNWGCIAVFNLGELELSAVL
jgi:hypothetical protein